MNASTVQISNIFNRSSLYEIPFYQRSYVWLERNWERFMQDMEYLSKSKKPYFMGALIMKGVYVPLGNRDYDHRGVIIDGQQRLTTFIVFMKVLCLKKNADDFFNQIFRLGSNNEIALKHNKHDAEAFDIIVNQTKAAPMSYDKSSLLVDAYNYFVNEINEEDYNENVIKGGAQFALIELNADENDQQVFDTINSIGVKLTTTELLKNYFYGGNDIEGYKKTWEPVFEKDANTVDYWNTKIAIGGDTVAMIDVFMDAYFQIFIYDKKYNVSSEDKQFYARPGSLVKSYRDFVEDYLGGMTDDIVNGFKKYASLFKDNFNPAFCAQATPAEYGTKRMNVIIFGMKHTSLIPYLLFVLDKADSGELEKICKALESYIMRRKVADMPTSNYSGLFTQLINSNVTTADELIKRLKADKTPESGFPSDDKVREGFHTSYLINMNAKAVLYLIESRIWRQQSSVKLLGFSEYSVEHLMPKNWRLHWKPEPETEQLKKERDDKLYRLGNLAIITQSLNSSIRDAEWQVKLQGNDHKNGLRNCAKGLETMENVLDKEVWNEAEIDKRGDWLAEKAIEVWNI